MNDRTAVIHDTAAASLQGRNEEVIEAWINVCSLAKLPNLRHLSPPQNLERSQA